MNKSKRRSFTMSLHCRMKSLGLCGRRQVGSLHPIHGETRTRSANCGTLGPAAWFVDGEAFSNWKGSEQSSLWIHGKRALWSIHALLLRLTPFRSVRRKERPVLCGLLRNSVPENLWCRPSILTYFYCDFKEEQMREIRGLLSPLLVQLLSSI
jgi:hypothetical protein